MAKGTNKIFDAVPFFIKDGRIDVSADTFKIALFSDAVGTINVSAADPDFSSFNEVSEGGTYSAGGVTLTLSNASASSVFSMKLDTTVHSAAQIEWLSNVNSPDNVRTAIIYDSSVTSALALCFYDCTEDGGTTAVDLTGRDLQINIGANDVVGEILRIKTSN